MTRVGNKILLSITNGVLCAVKIAWGTRNCYTWRASVLTGFYSRKLLHAFERRFEPRVRTTRLYARYDRHPLLWQSKVASGKITAAWFY